jgi:hypothetical protein
MRAVNPVEYETAQDQAGLRNLFSDRPVNTGQWMLDTAKEERSGKNSGNSGNSEGTQGKRTAGDPDARRMTP